MSFAIKSMLIFAAAIVTEQSRLNTKGAKSEESPLKALVSALHSNNPSSAFAPGPVPQGARSSRASSAQMGEIEGFDMDGMDGWGVFSGMGTGIANNYKRGIMTKSGSDWGGNVDSRVDATKEISDDVATLAEEQWGLTEQLPALGSTVKGTVTEFVDNDFIAKVDIGSKIQGLLRFEKSVSEIQGDNMTSVVKIGETYQFVVEGMSDVKMGEVPSIELSRTKFVSDNIWDEVWTAYEGDQTVKVVVDSGSENGVQATFKGQPVFIPGSHMFPDDNPAEMMGTEVEVKIVEINKDEDPPRIICSRRTALSRTDAVQLGEVVTGVVVTIKPFGAFVDIGGQSALLHISEISCDHAPMVNQVLEPGMMIKCMVIAQDRLKGRMSVSTKRLEMVPGDMITNSSKVFEFAEEAAAKYKERMEAERKAREEAAAEILFGLESIFTPNDMTDGNGQLFGTSTGSSVKKPAAQEPFDDDAFDAAFAAAADQQEKSFGKAEDE
jgi:small subunit ribosomal protein S1